MILDNGKYTIEISDINGAIESYSSKAKNFIADAHYPLFVLGLRSDDGGMKTISSDGDSIFSSRLEVYPDRRKAVLDYKELLGMPLSVQITIDCPIEDCFSYWRLSFENHTDYYVEWVDFPGVLVPNDLVANGGSGRIIWPGNDGLLVEDISVRENCTWDFVKYMEPKYPNRSTESIYPGPVSTQFMAYYCDLGGLYIGAHDDEGNVKFIDFLPEKDGIRLQFRLYTDAFSQGKYKMGYDMVLGIFSGDWYDAADIYRNWYKENYKNKPEPISNNPDLPDWYGESPIVITYPVRGSFGMDVMKPNKLFPYINAFPYIKKIADKTDSKILVLLMHWEGTAPWAPPYVWPPFGGEEALREYIERLHESGNLLGVYCSGFGWTEQSHHIPEYNLKEQFDRENLGEIMCTSPEGTLPYSNIVPNQRRGYDMCPSQSLPVDMLANEVDKIIEFGCFRARLHTQ
jgi:hypothetical protein